MMVALNRNEERAEVVAGVLAGLCKQEVMDILERVVEIYEYEGMSNLAELLGKMVHGDDYGD